MLRGQGVVVERYRLRRNRDRLCNSDRDSVADLDALQRVRVRHVDVLCRTIGSLQRDMLIGLVDRRYYDELRTLSGQVG